MPDSSAVSTYFLPARRPYVRQLGRDMPPLPQSVANFDVPSWTKYQSDTQLAEIERLGANWDGYGAHPIDAETAKFARNALAIFQRWDVVPDLTPNPNGTISFEWETPKGNAHLEMGKTRFVCILRPTGAATIPFSGVTTSPHGIDSQISFIAGALAASLFAVKSNPLTVVTFKAAHVREFA